MDTIIKRFESPDESRTFPKGKFELIHIGSMSIGRVRYEPGWKWSTHTGSSIGNPRCTIEHVGLVLQGRCAVAFDDGTFIELKAGEAFHTPAVPHDSWVVGDEAYVSLHFLGAEKYAR